MFKVTNHSLDAHLARAMMRPATLVGEMGESMPGADNQESFFVAETVGWPLRVVNAADAMWRQRLGRPLVPLDRQKIARWARVDSVHPAFGDQSSFFQLLESFFDGFAENSHLSATGILLITDWAKSCLLARRECMQYVSAHPEVLSQKIDKPVVIIGMHRTGSTLLHNLLHQDPKTRSPFMHEMYGNWPHLPVATSRAAQFQDPRMTLLKQLIERGHKLLPEGSAKRQRAHPSSPEMIEEEWVIAAHQMNWFSHIPLSGKRFKELILRPDKDFVFAYLKIYLQMLQTGYAPESHWTLKSPSHMLHIDSFMGAFPDARVVMLHRDPAVTVPSMCYLVESLYGSYFCPGTWDRRTLGPFVLSLYQCMTQRLSDFRDAHPDKAGQFLDIRFTDLEADPIGQVQRIYRTMGIEFEASLTAKLQSYLTTNRRHPHGKPDYSLAKYGLTPEDVAASFAAYRARYLD